MNRRKFIISAIAVIGVGVVATKPSILFKEKTVYEVIYSEDNTEYGILIYPNDLDNDTLTKLREFRDYHGDNKIISEVEYEDMKDNASNIEEIKKLGGNFVGITIDTIK